MTSTVAKHAKGTVVGECIHGLDEGLCDSCYPKPVLEAPPAPPRVTRATTKSLTTPRRAAASPGTKSTPRAQKATAGSLSGPPFNAGAQRIYHVTHFRNLPSILDSGYLLADASEAWDSRPVVDISSTDNRQTRRAAVVSSMGEPTEGFPADGTVVVAGYVPFFMTPNSSVWEGIRSGDADPRLSPDSHGIAASEFIVLVSTVEKAGRESAAVARGDAAVPATRFATTSEAIDIELRRLQGDEEAILDAEYLVPESFAFDNVTLIGVANDKARDEVRAILHGLSYSTKVAVYPPWFQKPED